jgi:hypothetical protein
MSEVKVSSFSPRNRIALVFYLCISCGGCTRTLITAPAPNGSATVHVKELCGIADCLIDVTVQKHWWQEEKTVISQTDCVINFAHVAWSPDSRVAAIFVDTGYCHNIQEGYDTHTSSLVPFSPYADLVRGSIIREYGVKPDVLARYHDDPLKWAHYGGDGTGSEGMKAFREKYDP